MIFERIVEQFKNFFSKRKRIVILIVLTVLLVTYLILGFIMQQIIDGLPDQHAAERWDPDSRISQVSMFFTEDQMITENTIRKLEYTMESKMVERGIISEDDNDSNSGQNGKIIDTVGIGKKPNDTGDEEVAKEQIKVYRSAYCAQGITTIAFERTKAENVDTIGVGGDFFLFHPMELVSGSYLSGDDIMKDRIVIDEDLAWQLFGSNDIVGQCVTIGGINHYIAGVVKRIDGRFPEAAGLTKGTAYISYDSLAKYGNILSGRTETKEVSEDNVTMQEGGINCYEVVMPGPVDNIVSMLVKESIGLDDKYIRVVDNTERFNGFALFEVASNFGIRSMWTQPIYYPYWENIARGWEDVLSILFLIRMVCIIAFWLIIATLVVISYRNKTWTVRGVINTLGEKKYDFEARLQTKKNEKKRLSDKETDDDR